MNTKYSLLVAAAFASLALAGGTVASAGILDKAADQLKDQSGQKADKKPDKDQGRPSSGPQRTAPSPSGGSHTERPRGAFGGLAPPHSDAREAGQGRPRDAQPGPVRPNGARPDSGGRDRPDRRNGGQAGNAAPPSTPGPTHDLNDSRSRLYGNRTPRNDHDGRGNGGGHEHRPPVVVERLPHGYRDYYWNGNRYYAYGGRWYRPYGSSYVTVGIPFGLFVTTLPGYYTSVWVDGTRYYYSDHTYYVYEPVRRGYVVTHSPYGDDEDEYADGVGDDLYIYPANGQSEQQQADDRYACHRWAVDQSDYDPLDDEYDASRRADYRRAMIACLTGRGYTVN
jgi:hypothetical protein